MKMTVTSAQRTFTATLKTILPYNLFLLYLYLRSPNGQQGPTHTRPLSSRVALGITEPKKSHVVSDHSHPTVERTKKKIATTIATKNAPLPTFCHSGRRLSWAKALCIVYVFWRCAGIGAAMAIGTA